MADVEITTARGPVKVLVVRYDCPFCGSGFRSSRKSYVVEHMARCWAEPAKKTCRTCAHFDRRALWGAEDVCALGENVPERAPVVNCPLWQDRDEEEAEELTAA